MNLKPKHTFSYSLWFLIIFNLQESIPPIVSFHLGSLGFLAPFQFTKTVGNTEKSIYKDYLDKALKGSASNQNQSTYCVGDNYLCICRWSQFDNET